MNAPNWMWSYCIAQKIDTKYYQKWPKPLFCLWFVIISHFFTNKKMYGSHFLWGPRKSFRIIFVPASNEVLNAFENEHKRCFCLLKFIMTNEHMWSGIYNFSLFPYKAAVSKTSSDKIAATSQDSSAKSSFSIFRKEFQILGCL